MHSIVVWVENVMEIILNVKGFFFFLILKFKLKGLRWCHFKIFKLKIQVLKLKFCSLKIWLYGHASGPWGAQLDPPKKHEISKGKKIYYI